MNAMTQQTTQRTQTAVEIMQQRGWPVSEYSYRDADEMARKNRCTYLYDAGNGNVGQASYSWMTDKVTHRVTRDAKVWL